LIASAPAPYECRIDSTGDGQLFFVLLSELLQERPTVPHLLQHPFVALGTGLVTQIFFLPLLLFLVLTMN
jgi:hypothetical protein